MSIVERFRELHAADGLFLMPNAWDVGSAKLLAAQGIPAIATTSSGAAAALGLPDGGMGRDAALQHAAQLAAAVEIPVSADLENCFADDPDGVADTIERAAALGLAGASVEDWSGTEIYDSELALARVRAAVRAADGRLVITARAENLLHGVTDLDDTLARLRAFADAGADCVFAPGLRGADQVRAAVQAVDVPVSVLVSTPDVPPVPELAELGVRRVSVGGAFAFAAYGELLGHLEELRGAGTYGFAAASRAGRQATLDAF